MSFEVDLDSAVPEEDYVASSTASKPQGSSGLHPKANQASEEKPFSVDLDSAVPDEEANQGFLGTLIDGTKSAGRAIGATYDTYTGDGDAVVDKANTQNKKRSDLNLERFNSDVAKNTGMGTDEEVGFADSVKGIGKAIWDNPKGAAMAVVEQFPNSVPTLAGGWAGAKAGAASGGAIGSAFGGVGAAPGALIGGTVGFLGGMFIGNTLTETGHKAMGYAGDGEFTADEQSATISEGAKKAGVITTVDALTFGIGGKISSTMRRTAEGAVEAATRKALIDAGVDVSDAAALAAARSNPQIARSVSEAQINAAKVADNLRKRAGEAGALLTMETVGEGLGEYLGELAATGQASVSEAVLESFLSLGQSGVQAMFNFAKARENSLTDQEWVDAANGVPPAGMPPEQMPPADGLWDAPPPEASIDMGQMQDSGITPPPVFDSEDFERSQGLTPSQQMGIDPNAGSLSAAAAQAVDSGVFSNEVEQQPGINQLALERQGVSPPPVLSSEQMDRGLGLRPKSTAFDNEAPNATINAEKLQNQGVTQPPILNTDRISESISTEESGQYSVGQKWAKGNRSYTIESVSDDGRSAMAVSGNGKKPFSINIDSEKTNGWKPQPTAQVEQQALAQSSPAATRTPEQDASASWNTMSAIERTAIAEAVGVRGVPAKNLTTKNWESLSDNQRASLTGAVNERQGKRWNDSNVTAKDQAGPVLQPRDRSQQEPIRQMNEIANKPDYSKASYSRTFTDGAPVTIDEIADLPASQRGKQETVSTASERKIPIQYAVVEAEQLLPSNNVDGSSNANYANGEQGKSRSIAGNGRVAGISKAWERGTAEQYKADMIADDLHGIDPGVIQSMKKPVLVRLMPMGEVTDDIGDLSNRDGKIGQSVVERAKEDGRSVDIANLEYDANGNVGGDTVKDFVSKLPGANNLVSNGSVTQEARDRLNAALFQKAYSSDKLTELLTERGEGARSVINAMAIAAPHMTKLEAARGTGFDIRGLVAQAGEIALTAARDGVNFASRVKQLDMGVDAHVYPILEMMANEKGNVRSAKYISEQLINLANLAYYEAQQQGVDMFGERTARTTSQIIDDSFSGVTGDVKPEEATGNEPASQESMGQQGRSEPNAQVVEGPEVGQQRPANTGRAESGEQEQPVVEPAAPKSWRTNYLQAAKVAREKGIDPKQFKKLPELVAAIDAKADTASQSIEDLQKIVQESSDTDPFGDKHISDQERLYELMKKEAVAEVAAGRPVVYEGVGNNPIHLTITPSAKHSGQYQVTRYNETGALGDSQYNTLDKAFEDNQVGIAYGSRRVSGEQADSLLNRVMTAEAERNQAPSKPTEDTTKPTQVAVQKEPVPDNVRKEVEEDLPASSQQQSEYRSLNSMGEVTDGIGIKPGEQFNTASGRLTTGYPKQKQSRYASQWLIDNAALEAESRGDTFNARPFRSTPIQKDGTLTVSDRESMSEYLFGQQPEVFKSALKDLSDIGDQEAASPELTLEQQTEESRAESEQKEKERLDEVKKEEARQAKLERDQREKAADAQAIESSLDRFELGQSADQQLSGQGDVFDVKPDSLAAENELLEKYKKSVMDKADSFAGTYDGRPLKGLAQDFAKHAIDNGRRTTGEENAALAKKYDIPEDVVEAISVNVFTYDGILGDKERGNKQAGLLIQAGRDNARKAEATDSSEKTAKQYITDNFEQVLSDLKVEAEKEINLAANRKVKKTPDVLKIREVVAKKHSLQATGWDEADVILGKALLPVIGIDSAMGGAKQTLKERLDSIEHELRSALGMPAKETAAEKNFNFTAIVRNEKGEPFHVNTRRGGKANVAPFVNGKPEIHSGNPTIDLTEYTFDNEFWKDKKIVKDEKADATQAKPEVEEKDNWAIYPSRKPESADFEYRAVYFKSKGKETLSSESKTFKSEKESFDWLSEKGLKNRADAFLAGKSINDNDVTTGTVLSNPALSKNDKGEVVLTHALDPNGKAFSTKYAFEKYGQKTLTNWFDIKGDLLGQFTKLSKPTNTKEGIKQAQEKAKAKKGIAGAIDSVIDEQRAIAKDWADRDYKKNNTKVELVGDGPSNADEMSISSINENRRKKAIESANNAIRVAEKLKAKIAEQGEQETLDWLSAIYDKAENGIGLPDPDPKSKTGKLTQDQFFEQQFLRNIGFDGDRAIGASVSNSLSKAALEAVKKHRASKPKDAATDTANDNRPLEQIVDEFFGETKPAAIEDFGEKIEGARKDLQKSLDKTITNDDVIKQTLSKIWPASELDSIDDPVIAALSYVARSLIPAKPRVAYKLERWVQQVQQMRLMAKLVKDGQLTLDNLHVAGASTATLKSVADKAKLLSELDRKDWPRIGMVEVQADAYNFDDNGEKVPAPNVLINIDGKYVRLNGLTSISEAVGLTKAALSGAEAVNNDKKMAFEIRQSRVDGRIFINKKGDREYRELKVFAKGELKQARDFVKNNHDELVAAWDAVKERDNVGKGDVRGDSNRERTGPDYRNGKDVTPEQFSDMFGFRGVQFGNWVKQGAGSKDRQGMLNSAYDALMDLAQVVGAPPQAMSLNGTMALAFGARGKGKAMAHFERDRLVINLTKTKGAGSLAHEWFHALDNYFSRQRTDALGDGDVSGERKDNYITYLPEPMMVNKKSRRLSMTQAEFERRSAEDDTHYNLTNYEADTQHPKGVRPVVEKAFAQLVQALNESPMKDRAKVVDMGQEDGYWSRIIELAARSFENYVIAKLDEQGLSNDFLANVVPIEEFKRNPGRYPYLLDEEVKPVAKAFDALFGTIESRKEQSGTVLFSLSDNRNAPATVTTNASLLKTLSDNYPSLVTPVITMLKKGRTGAKGGLIIVNSNDSADIAAAYSKATGEPFGKAIRLFSDGETINGFYDVSSGITFLIGPNLDAASAPAVLLHEVTHSQQRKGIDERALNLIDNRGKEKNADLKAFLDTVAQRMENAGEAGNATEATTYIVEQAVLDGKSRGYTVADSKFLSGIEKVLGSSVANIVRDFIKMVRQFALRNNMPINISLDDLVQYAMASVEQAAAGKSTNKQSQGQNYSFAGERALTASKANLSKAQDMIIKGMDADEVRQETGWFQGADENWRFELNDSDAAFVDAPSLDSYLAGKAPRKAKLNKQDQKQLNILKIAEAEASKVMFAAPVTERVTDEWSALYDKWSELSDKVRALENKAQGKFTELGEVIEHEQLFAAYPDMKAIKVQLAIDESSETNGSYDRENNKIVMTAPNKQELMGGVLHEIQHAIQKVEAFARGGTPRAFSAKDVTSEYLKRLGSDLITLLNSNPKFGSAVRAVKQEWIKLTNKYPKTTRDGQDSVNWDAVPQSEQDAYFTLMDATEAFDEADKWHDIETKQRIARRDGVTLTAFEQYQRLAGEVEARNVETRLFMTDEERREFSPEATEDVDRADQSVRFSKALKDSGPESSAWKAAKAKGLDMTKAARMERAEAMGFDTGTVWYHGTYNDFESFSKGGEYQIGGVHIGTKKAANEALEAKPNGDNKNPKVIPVIISAKNAYRMKDFEHWEPSVVARQLIRDGINIKSKSFLGAEFYTSEMVISALNNAGYDSIIYKNNYEDKGSDSLIVFDPNSIRSINAAFDPSQADSPNLMFSRRAQTDSAAFKRWFGDSKIVDANGEPLVMYHGTASDFSEFSKTKATDKEGRKISMGWGKGKFYFASTGEAASSSAQFAQSTGRGSQQNVMPVYLSIENPIDAADYMSMVYEQTSTGKTRDAAIAAVDKKLKKQGVDGIVDSASGGMAVFEPTQIKSATGNNGDFDGNNPDIRFSRAPKVGTEAFNKMFGETKAVDDNGNPKMLYHGTNADITSFEKSMLGANTLAESAELGFFFTDDITTAESYANYAATTGKIDKLYREADKAADNDDWDAHDDLLTQAETLEAKYSDPKNRQNGQNIIPVYIAINNPLIVDAKGEDHNGFDIPAAIKKAKKEKRDGLIIKNLDDAVGLSNRPATHYVAFNSEQIKSAIGNNGNYDSANPDIRYSRMVKGENDENLYVAHNLTEDNLRYAVQIGGLAAPSLAVGNIDTGAFNNFGEITLLARPELLGSPKARTFDADVYTPRHPRAEYEVSAKAWRELKEKADNLPGDLRFPTMNDVERDGAKAFLYSDGAKLLYLQEQGKAPATKPVKTEPWIKKAAAIDVFKYDLANNKQFQKLVTKEAERIYASLVEAGLDVAERREHFYFTTNEDGTRQVSVSYLTSSASKVVRYMESGGIDDAQLRADVNKKLRTKKSDDDFKTWVNKQLDEIVTRKRIDVGETASGNRKYIPYNLDNIVKTMTRELRGGEGYNYGPGSIRAMYANELKSLSAVKARRNQIISAEQFDEIKDESGKKVSKALIDLQPFYRFDSNSFTYEGDATSAIAEGPAAWKEAFEITEESRKIITDLIEYLRTLPTEYFETKVGRAVDIKEFSYAIVPSDASSDIPKLLREKGIQVKRYKANDNESREQAIRSTKGILFSKKAKEDALKSAGIEISDNRLGKTYTDKNGATISVMEGAEFAPRENSVTNFVVPENARGRGVGSALLKAVVDNYGAETMSAAASSESSVRAFYSLGFRPGFDEKATLASTLERMKEWSSVTMLGPKSDTQELLFSKAQTNTPAFKKWFGDSKVVDANGEPLVVYHGTAADFSEFDLNLSGSATDAGTEGQGFYFISDPSAASSNADWVSGFGERAGANVMPVYLNITNPYKITKSNAPKGLENDPKAASKFTRNLIKQGYDGVEYTLSSGIKSYVAFEPTQIKSAIGNNGDFDGTNPDIRYSRAYHGSPHKFDRFSLEAMGSGEGAQAYGWGLYFAENREIAEHYRDVLGYVSLKPKDESAKEKLRAALNYADGAASEVEAISQQLNYDDNKIAAELVKMAGRLESQANGGNPYYIDAYRTMAEMISAGELETEKKSNLYQVDIPEKDELISWDNALTQSQKAIVSKSMPHTSTAKTGSELYAMLSRELGGDKNASKHLNSLGIKGIYYLDGVSRKNDGEKNNYVIWDETAVTIEAVNDQQKQADIMFSRFAATDRLVTEAEKAMKGADGFLDRNRKIPGNWTQGQKDAARKFDTFTPRQPIASKIKQMKEATADRAAQLIFDQFRPLRNLSEEAFMQAHLARGAEGALEALATKGLPKLKDGAIAVDVSGGGFIGALSKLGDMEEVRKFLMWVAANRADNLMSEGRENLFTDDDIAAMKQFATGTTASGQVRRLAYGEALTQLNAYNKAVLDIAQEAGLVNGEARQQWESDFYIPFYRVLADEDGVISKKHGHSDTGLMRQEVIKRLKGGKENLGDPLENVMANWSSLLTSSMKNMAANKALEQGVVMGIAEETNQAFGNQLWTMQDGKKKYWEVHDKYVLESLEALNFSGYNNGFMKAAGAFKRMLTIGVTISPTFRVRNLIRDTLHAIAVADTSYNPLKNAVEGWKMTSKENDTMAQLMAGGGAVRFGSFNDGQAGNYVERMIKNGIQDGQILNTPAKMKKALGRFYTEYQEIGDRSETINRAVVYQRVLEKTGSHLEASFAARDLMNFTSMGSAAAIRALSQILPFFNARLQGLDKLGRGAVADPRRFWSVAGTIGMASALLFLLQGDDDEYKALPDYIRDTYWPVKLGGTWLYIPKPFEIGSMGTVVERFTELMFSDGDYKAKDFKDSLIGVLINNLEMNPVPQIIRPASEAWFNYDMFRQQPIDSMAMDRLMPEDRHTANTSTAAVIAGQTMGVSPQKIEHLIRGYFGWLGTQALNVGDILGRTLTDRPSSPKWDLSQTNNMFIVGDFLKEAGSTPSKYSTRFYDVQRDIDRIYATANNARKTGDMDRFKELVADPKMKARPLTASANNRMTLINQQIRATLANRTISASEKNERINKLHKIREDIAKKVDEVSRK